MPLSRVALELAVLACDLVPINRGNSESGVILRLLEEDEAPPPPPIPPPLAATSRLETSLERGLWMEFPSRLGSVLPLEVFCLDLAVPFLEDQADWREVRVEAGILLGKMEKPLNLNY